MTSLFSRRWLNMMHYMSITVWRSVSCAFYQWEKGSPEFSFPIPLWNRIPGHSVSMHTMLRAHICLFIFQPL